MEIFLDIFNHIITLKGAIDWINVVAGAMLGAFVSMLPSTLRVMSALFRDKYISYYGEYYIYNWAVTGGEIISEKKLLVSRNWRGYPNLILYIDEHVMLTYKGVMRSNKRSLYFDLYGEGHAEELKIIFHEPLDKTINVLVGVFSATTLDSDPMAGKLVISRTRLGFDEAKPYLGARKIIIVDSKRNRNIPLKPTNSIVFINEKIE